MKLDKILKLLGIIVFLSVLNVIVLSPGFLDVSIKSSNALEAAFGVTLPLISGLILVYSMYQLLFKSPATIPVKQIKTYEDYVEGLSRYKSVKALTGDIHLALTQMERMKKRTDTLANVLQQRFEPSELSFKKFASVSAEVEKLFFLNVRSILNRLSVFDETEFESVMNNNTTRFSSELIHEKREVFQEYLSFVKGSLDANEEILLKLDKLLLEISRLDSFELGDIENMPGMQEIDLLIKQTKLYK